MPYSIKLGTNYPWVKGIQVCSKEGDSPFPRGADRERANLKKKNLILQNQQAKINQTSYKLFFGKKNSRLFK